MASNIRVRVLQNRFRSYSREIQQAYKVALNDVVDDLVRTSSQTAPHDEGILEKSWTKEIKVSGNEPYGIVSFSVNKADENGNKFNYALKMHEEQYDLGEKSAIKPGGTGMSGRTYPVGTGYLGDVLKGETEAYRNHIAEAIRNVNSNF